VNGLKALYTNEQKIIHRDLKLENLLIHFNDVDMWEKSLLDRMKFLKSVNLEEVSFTIQIADLGFAKSIA